MKPPLSNRHHYLPVFYLNGFVNKGGEFAIYDKSKEIQSTKFFRPTSYFFEWKRNLIDVKGTPDDFIELHYSKLDSQCGGTFSSLQKDYKRQITPLDLFNISLFIKTLFWRIPNKDKKIDLYIDSLPKELLGFNLLDKDGNDAPEEFYRKILIDPKFRKAYRSILPLINYELIKQEELIDWKFVFASDEAFHLCGDSPLIFRNYESDQISGSDFILPITQNNLLIHKRNPILQSLSPELRVKIDILVFAQAQRYVCSRNPDYLTFIASYTKGYTEEMLLILKEEIFASV
jgi:hypothetical protein